VEQSDRAQLLRMDSASHPIPRDALAGGYAAGGGEDGALLERPGDERQVGDVDAKPSIQRVAVRVPGRHSIAALMPLATPGPHRR